MVLRACLHLLLVICFLLDQAATAIDGSGTDAESAAGECLMQTRSQRQGSLSAASTALAEESQSEGVASLAVGTLGLRNKSSFHEIVGDDGAFMIVLERLPARSSLAMSELAKVGINAASFPATDGQKTSAAVLEGACPKMPAKACNEGGCINSAVQGIAHSHQQLLKKAMTRKENWTAIFEDDAVPVLPDGTNWDVEFGKAWARRPADAKVVRLGWCQPWWAAAMNREPIDKKDGLFQWLQFHHGSLMSTQGSTTPIGGCTHAYIVHKEIIPSMLEAFPCCCPVDCCFEYGFFPKHDASILANLIGIGSDEYIGDHGGNDQYGPQGLTFRGVVMQASKELGHTYSRTFDFLSNTSSMNATTFSTLDDIDGIGAKTYGSLKNASQAAKRS